MVVNNFEKFINFFQKKYVLTIPRAKDRQMNIEKQFMGCKFEFLYGMDAKEESIKGLLKSGVYSVEKAKRLKPDKTALSLGEIACSWGHTQIFKRVIEENLKKVMIFEDDVVVNLDAFNNISEILNSLPEDADLVYWGYDRLAKRRRFHFCWKLYWHIKLIVIKGLFGKKRNGFYIDGFPVIDHSMIENLHIRPYNKHFSIAGAHYSTHAYSINEKAAETLLSMQNPISHVADFLLIYAILHKKIKAYIVNVPLFIQDKYQTTVSLNQYLER